MPSDCLDNSKWFGFIMKLLPNNLKHLEIDLHDKDLAMYVFENVNWLGEGIK